MEEDNQLFNYCKIVQHQQENRTKYPAIIDVYFVDLKHKRKVQIFGMEKEITMMDIWKVNHN